MSPGSAHGPRPHPVRDAMGLAVAGILALLSLGLWGLGFRVHQGILGVDAGLALALVLAGTVAAGRRAPERGRAPVVVALGIALSASLATGAGLFLSDGWHLLATLASDAPPATTGCGNFGRPGGPWNARARRAVVAAFPGARVTPARACWRFVHGGDRVVRLRVGPLTAPARATTLVVTERVTFPDGGGGARVVLAPYPDAAAATRDLARLDTIAGGVARPGRRRRLCRLDESRIPVLPGWRLDCAPPGGGPGYRGRVPLPRRP